MIYKNLQSHNANRALFFPKDDNNFPLSLSLTDAGFNAPPIYHPYRATYFRNADIRLILNP